ncbi:hypothetical protein G6M70_04235 [Agrobacterium tumefaciens]|uniref:hypothetical protein n=1 Tax=Agrobacterium tumefaciens TaxID=358 RepID=UPI0015729314|nr:hypothetical protein [Agrobacterium tumefaciens]NSY99762.1 hypothetical protein [Agrobacterium tumefaciens]NSZ38167.1 hypothetical protein [Agrobacterium tumefaciens]NTB22040.1 hypothetical protein [Agrobacterium tumefaciens]NTB31890.1 hypothetical protein [Agrobacterium tumefaciens]NTB36469.1 hypothetical protein [Agrobacterium tumefaciens]
MSEAAIPFTTFKFDETDRVRIRGTYYRVRRREDGLGYRFTEIGGMGDQFSPTHFKISEMVAARTLKVERRWFVGLPEGEVPSLTTFQRWRRNILEDLHVAAAHHGDDAAKDDFQMTGAGQRRYKPLERIELDEHKLDLMLLLKGTRLWGKLHDDVQKKIEAMRFWVSVAIDVGTKSILAMRILDGDPGGRSAIETLRMACSPKEGTALFAGSESPWPMYGKPGIVATDSGAAYNQRDFQMVVVSLCDAHLIPPVRNARLRGTVERYFRTFNDRYMHLFPGRTYSNPIMRGAYDSKANAAMDFEEFARHLVRLIVDAYARLAKCGDNDAENVMHADNWRSIIRTVDRHGNLGPTVASSASGKRRRK